MRPPGKFANLAAAALSRRHYGNPRAVRGLYRPSLIRTGVPNRHGGAGYGARPRSQIFRKGWTKRTRAPVPVLAVVALLSLRAVPAPAPGAGAGSARPRWGPGS